MKILDCMLAGLLADLLSWFLAVLLSCSLACLAWFFDLAQEANGKQTQNSRVLKHRAKLDSAVNGKPVVEPPRVR